MSGNDQPASAVPQQPVEFHSWKEIAAYFGVSVRRAQQWEAELGLPVRRIQLGSRPRLSARRAELDEWLERRSRARVVVGDKELAPLDERAPDVERPISRATRSRKVLAVAGVAALLLAAAGWAVQRGDRRPHSAAVVDGLLRVSDSRGRLLWQVGFPEGRAVVPRPAIGPARVNGFWTSNTHIIEDLDGDSAAEVLFVLSRTVSKFEPLGAVANHGHWGDLVICYGAGGGERWRFVPGRLVSWQGRAFDGQYFVSWVIGPFPVAGRPTLAVGAQNAFFPFQITLLDARTGEVSGEFWHLGGFPAALVTDWNRDGDFEILAGGVNNPGPGPGLPALARLRASSLEPLPADADPWEHPAGIDFDYLLFPPLNRLEPDEIPRRIAWMTLGPEGLVQMGVSSGPGFEDRGQIHYTLSGDLEVLDARPSDFLLAYHRRLLGEGHATPPLTEAEIAAWRVVRRFDRMPNANHPEIRILWAPTAWQQRQPRRP